MLDELADFELGGGLEDDFSHLGGESLLEDAEMDTFGSATGGFGDLNSDNLPDFFKNPTQLEQENYDIFDSMANQTLDDDLDLGKHLYRNVRSMFDSDHVFLLFLYAQLRCIFPLAQEFPLPFLRQTSPLHSQPCRQVWHLIALFVALRPQL